MSFIRYFMSLNAKELNEILSVAEHRILQSSQHIEEWSDWKSSGFVDGSYVVDERKGALVTVFSVASLYVNKEGRITKIKGVMKGSKEPIPFILFPRFNSEVRCSILMKSLELLAALDLIRKGCEYVYIDGSYLSLLLSPSSIVRIIFKDIKSSLINNINNVIIYFKEFIDKVYESVETTNKNARWKFIELLSILVSNIQGIYRRLVNELSVRIDSSLRKNLFDYIALALEENLSLVLSNILLEESKDNDSKIFWIAKDTESRSLAEALGLIGWYTDTSLLDYVWRAKKEALLDVSKIAPLKPVSPLRGTMVGEKGDLIYEPTTALRFYRRWGGYKMWYFKLSKTGTVLQLSYPARYGKSSGEEAVSILYELRDERHGYPKPLAYVHHTAVLSQDLARLIGDESWKNARDPLIRSLLSSSGRRVSGL